MGRQQKKTNKAVDKEKSKNTNQKKESFKYSSPVCFLDENEVRPEYKLDM